MAMRIQAHGETVCSRTRSSSIRTNCPARSLCYPPWWLLVSLAWLNVSQRQPNQSGSHRRNPRKILYVIHVFQLSLNSVANLQEQLTHIIGNRVRVPLSKNEQHISVA